jgi:hypothetical protein
MVLLWLLIANVCSLCVYVCVYVFRLMIGERVVLLLLLIENVRALCVCIGLRLRVGPGFGWVPASGGSRLRVGPICLHEYNIYIHTILWVAPIRDQERDCRKGAREFDSDILYYVYTHQTCESESHSCSNSL